MELYLNKIALGHRSYGVVAAAQTYYGKTLEELSLAEIATIAGLPKAPSTLNPITSPQRAKDRRHLVLQRMLTLGYITPEEFELADSAPSRAFFHSAPLEAYAPYVAEEARQAVIAKYGEDAYIKGLKVYTTVDSQYQQYAHDAIFENLTAYDVRHGYRGPLLNIFDSTRGLRGSAKLATEKNGAHANANNGVIMAKRAELAEQYEAQGIKYDYQTLVSEVDKLNLLATQIAKVEQDFNNEKALDLIRKENKYQSIDPALVVSVDDENKQAIVLLPNGEQKALTWDGMSWARAFKTDRSQGNDPKYPSEFLQAGDLIFTYVKQVEPKKKAKNNEPQVTEVLTLTQIPDVESALISLDPKTGAVRAMAGGFDFEKSKFNRTTQLLRQTGSSFKPFIYSSAIAYGIALNSVIPDEPIKTWDVGSRTWWQPRNSPNRFDGLMTIREGLAKSKNSIAIRTIRHVGVENAVEHLRKFNILVPKFQQSEAMALGSVEVTPLQLATAYSAFANGGYKITPYLIEKIEMENGEVLYQAHPKIADHSLPDNIANAIDLRYAGNYKPDARDRTLARFVNNKNETNYPNLNLDSYDETNITIGDDMPKRPVKDHLENIALPSSAKLSMAALSDLDSLASPNSNYPHPPQILSHTHAYLISSLMHSNVYGGEGLNGRYWGTGAKAAALTGRDDLHAKTGTTNNVHDAWFSGYNGNLVVTTWVGFDNDRDLGYTRGRGSESGGVTALPIFSSFFKKAQEGVESAQIPRPRGLSWTTNREITEPAIPGMIVIDDGSSAQSVKNTGIDSSDVNSGDIF